MKSLTTFALPFLLSLGCGTSNNPPAEKPPIKSDDSKQAVTTSGPVGSQVTPQVSVFPISHATMRLSTPKSTIYVDPVGGAESFAGHPNPTLVLITDIHGDHLDVKTLQELALANATIVAPAAVAEQLPSGVANKIITLPNGQTETIDDVTVSAVPMYNLREEAKAFHAKGRGNGYVIEVGGSRIYISGDTEDIPEMRALKNIEAAFVCMNLPYTMPVASAADAVIAFKPTKVFPYHYRGKPDVADVKKFKELVNAGAPDVQVIQLDWYPSDPF